MNIRYIKRHLPLRNSRRGFLQKLFRFRPLQIVLALVIFGSSVSGVSAYTTQTSTQNLPVSPIPQDTLLFKHQQQVCEESLALLEKQIEATIYLKQHAESNVDKKRLAGELQITQSKLTHQLEVCNQIPNERF